MRCVHELFEEQAARTPGATALIHDGERIDYAGLDERAARMAGLLAAKGIRAGDTVGVHLERSTALVVAVLGILKAGAGYVMLDPGFPAERLRTMAEDARVVAVVAARDAAPGAFGVAPVHIEDAHGARPLPRGAVPVRPDDIACVMFTSGSTGRPKGIASSHHAITATLTGQTFASFGPGSVWLQCAPLSWDACALELWGPLMNGGTCVLHPGQRPEPFVMARLVAEHGITSMYLSASLFNVIVDEYPQVLDGLRELVVGGEALSVPHTARALERCPRLRLSNGYGPVECMIFLTVHPVTLAELGDGPVPIGRPLAGKRLYILDEDLCPVPDGGTGEIYAAGAGVAREYRGRPALTAERFVAAPTGERVYRTGDLGRRRADGVFEYLGRADSQVKIRGFRVEPGEVETVLTRHPGIDRAAVVAHEHPAGDRQLTAYVVPRGGDRRAFREAELRAYARGILADYLVPAVFVPLDALPLTPSGKLDRAALPEPGPATAPAPAAVSGTVAALCALFSQVLHRDPVGPDDDFFSLGGHSLLAARLLGRIHTVLGVEIDVRGLFEAPTPARLAPLVDTAPPAPSAAPAPPGTASGTLPVSHAQHRLWFLDRIGAGAAYNLPMLVRLRGTVDPAALDDALAQVADRHEVLRTVFEECDGSPVRRVLSGAAARPPSGSCGSPRSRWTGRSSGRPATASTCVPNFPYGPRCSPPRNGRTSTRSWCWSITSPGTAGPCGRSSVICHAPTRPGCGARTRPCSPARRPVRGARPSPARPARLRCRSACAGRPSAHLLAQGAGRAAGRWCAAAPPHRTPRRTRPGRTGGGPAARRGGPRPGGRIGPRPGCHALHGPARRAGHRAGAGRCGRGPGDRRPGGRARRGRQRRGRRRVLRQHAGAAHRSVRRPHPGRGARPGPGDGPRRLQPPGRAVRGRGRGPQPTALPGRQPFTDVVLALQNNARAEVALPGAEHGVEIVRTGAARFELLVDVTDSTSAQGAPDGLTLTFEYRGEELEADFVHWLASALPEALEAAAADPDKPLSRLGLTEPPRRAGESDRIVPPARHQPAGQRPMTALERETAAVWCEVLGVPSAGPDDDFFALGGNSLRAVRAVARLGAGRPVTVAQLLAAPTVAAFAAELERAVARPAPAAAAPIPRRPRVPRRPQPQTQPSRKQEEWQWTSV